MEKKAFFLCGNLESIEIPNDSKLQTIHEKAFHSSTIKSIRIPSELIELKDGWCNYTRNLTQIEVSPKNPRYCCFNEKMIIGKKNIDSNNYDCLVFCVRDIERITIPNFIKHICSSSFDTCLHLELIEFANDSKLQTIDKNAFCFTAIKRIQIPSSVTFIGEYAFNECENFESIEFANDSKLQTIGKWAFNNTAIHSIIIPSSVTFIDENVFHTFENPIIIEIKNTEKISLYQTAFKNCKNSILMIPFHL